MVTSLYAGILGILYLALTFYTIKGRFKYKVPLGDGANPELTRRIRVHANFMEYVPLALILMILVELEGMSETALNIMGVALVVARLGHAWGLARSENSSIGRAGGTILTLLIIAAASVHAIKSYFFL